MYNISNIASSHISITKNIWDFLGLFEVSLGSPKINHVGFRAHGHVRKSRNHENEGFGGFPIKKSKSYWSKMQQHNSMELSCCSFHNIYNQNCTPDPPRPQIRIFLRFLRGSVGNRFFQMNFQFIVHGIDLLNVGILLVLIIIFLL